jgi:CheY-like chemotaxis protein
MPLEATLPPGFCNEIMIAACSEVCMIFLGKDADLAGHTAPGIGVVMRSDSSLQPESNRPPSEAAVLVVARQDDFGPFFSTFLDRLVGCQSDIVEEYGDFKEVMQALSHGRYDLLLVTDNTLVPDQIRELVPRVREAYPGVAIIVLSCSPEREFQFDMARGGANEFIEMPFEIEVLVSAVKRHCHLD